MGFIENILIFDNIFKKLPKKGQSFKPKDSELWKFASNKIDSEFDEFYKIKITSKPNDDGKALNKNLKMLLYSTIEVIMDITGGKQKGGAGDSDDEGRMEVYDRQVAWENALEYIRNNFMIVPRDNNNQVVPSNRYEPRPEDIISPTLRMVIDGVGVAGWCNFAWSLYTFYVCITDLYNFFDIHLGWKVKKPKNNNNNNNNKNQNLKALPLPERLKKQLVDPKDLEYEIEEIRLFDGIMKIFKDRSKFAKDMKKSLEIDYKIAYDALVRKSLETIQKEAMDTVEVGRDKYDDVRQETDKIYDKYGELAFIKRALNWYHGNEVRQILDDGSIAGQQAMKYKTTEFISRISFELNEAQDKVTNKYQGAKVRAADDILGLWGAGRSIIMFLLALWLARKGMRYMYKNNRERLINIVEEAQQQQQQRQQELQELHDSDTSNVVSRNILPPTRQNSLRIRTPSQNLTYSEPGTPNLEFEEIQGGRRKRRKKSRKKRRKSKRKSRRKKKKSRRKRRKSRKMISSRKKRRGKY